MSDWHGTLGGYNNHGCRCDDCRRAHREYQRKYRDAHPERDRFTGRLKGEASPVNGVNSVATRKRPRDGSTSGGMATKEEALMTPRHHIETRGSA